MAENKIKEELNKSHALLNALGEAQASYISETRPNDLFDKLLAEILKITDSEYGFIGQVLRTEKDEPYLKNFATTNIAWNKETRDFYEKHKEDGLEFYNMNSLLGLVITSGKPVISNYAPNDKRGTGIPEGHPPLNTYLGLPCYIRDNLVGMVAIANRPGGYDEEVIELLSPMLSTTANIIEAFKNDLKRKKTEQALKETQERFMKAQEIAHVGTWDWDPNTGELLWTDEIYKILGYSPGEVEPSYELFLESVHPDDRDRLGKAVTDAFKRKKPYDIDCRIIKKDGSTGEANAQGDVYFDEEGKPLRMLGLFQDITERKVAENIVKTERKRLFSILDSFPGFIYLQAKDHTIPFANQKFIDHYGDPTGKKCHELMWDREAPCDECKTFDVFKTKKPLEWISEHSSRKNLYQVYDFPFIDTDGTFLVLELSIDITEKKQAEEALKKSEQLLQSVLDNSTTVVYVKDPEGKYLLINTIYEKLFHVNRNAIIGKTDHDIFPEDMAEAFRANDLKILETGESMEFEEVAPHDDGPHTYISVKFPLKDSDNKPYAVCGISTDITDRTRMEADRLKMQKLESIGVLAGGIAHDFNNLLTGILGNVSLSMMGLTSEDKIYKRLKEAERASLFARDLTQQLLTFSKGGAPVMETLLVEELIREPAHLALRGSDKTCLFEIADGLPSVEADIGQIAQAINNLVINADQAMDEGGVINISAEAVSINKKNRLPLKSGDYILIRVADEGTGITPEHLSKVFDPYFTTKQKGSGLGLASVYSIIKNHAGHIDLNSKVGKGTTFNIYLPVSHNKAMPAKTKEKKVFRGSGRVLVMDDEEIIRELLNEFLTELGYEVECTSDGTEALKTYTEAKEAGRPFEAVIMDLTIQGGMGGKEAIKLLLEEDPEAKAIVSSGYSNDPVIANYRTFGFSGYLNKPYKVPILSKVLSEVINGSRQ